MSDSNPSGASLRAPEAGDRAAQPGRSDVDLAGRLRAAQHALLSRPRLSMQVRLVASLLLCFLLCCAFALVSLDLLHRTRSRIHLLQTVERLDDRIHRVRALANEGILSSGDLERMLEGAKEAEDLFRREPRSLREEDRQLLPNLLRHVQATRLLLATSETAGHSGVGVLSPAQAAELRSTGADANQSLEALIRRERLTADRILRIAESGALVLLLSLLVLFSVITLSFARALAAPLRRFKGYTSRIAGGDFSFIRPARKYRDEFSDLAVAVNQMLAELRAQQDRVVRGAKLAAVGTLTSGIAHELNNPLNNISITAEALMEGLATFSEEEKWRHLQDIYFETERASEIVKSLLDFTRKEKPDTALVDLQEVLPSTIRLVQNEMAINNVTLAADVPADLPPVLGAANAFRQVFLNLLLNAIQAMPGGGSITVRANLHAPERVCVDVSDTGPGIAPDVLPRIFDPFFTTKEPGKGTGLGLSTSLGIVRKFGGDIHVTSEPGHGTVFHVCLPRAGAR